MAEPGAGVRETQMRRTQLLVIIPLLMLSLAAAQSSAPQAPAAAAEHPLIQKVDVLKSGDGISVEITGSAQLTATAMMVPNPDRVVVDVPGGVVPHFRHIAVGADGIKSVRLGQKSANPPVARLVVDLAAARDYQLVRAGNRVVLKLRPAGALLARAASVPKPAIVPAVQPVRAAVKAPTAPAAPLSDGRARFAAERTGGARALIVVALPACAAWAV